MSHQLLAVPFPGVGDNRLYLLKMRNVVCELPFLVKGQIVNILDVTGYIWSLEHILLCF